MNDNRDANMAQAISSRSIEDMSDAEMRAAWRDLVERRLPQAHQPGWPVRYDHCFARILLDVACGQPWRTVMSPPAWKQAPRGILQRAIEVGEGVLSGEVDLRKLNRKSLRYRGKLK